MVRGKHVSFANPEKPVEVPSANSATSVLVTWRLELAATSSRPLICIHVHTDAVFAGSGAVRSSICGGSCTGRLWRVRCEIEGTEWGRKRETGLRSGRDIVAV
jgi:hypothetical protein